MESIKKLREVKCEGTPMSANESEFTREYECEYYRLKAHPRSCFFCDNCTDIFFDYTNGPYMLFCSVDADIDTGMRGECGKFTEGD